MPAEHMPTERPFIPSVALFHWTCEVGTFWIAQDESNSNQYRIGRGDAAFTSHVSPEAAAAAFYRHEIHDPVWDDSTIPGPEDLNCWLHTRRKNS